MMSIEVPDMLWSLYLARAHLQRPLSGTNCDHYLHRLQLAMIRDFINSENNNDLVERFAARRALTRPSRVTPTAYIWAQHYPSNVFLWFEPRTWLVQTIKDVVSPSDRHYHPKQNDVEGCWSVDHAAWLLLQRSLSDKVIIVECRNDGSIPRVRRMFDV